MDKLHVLMLLNRVGAIKGEVNSTIASIRGIDDLGDIQDEMQQAFSHITVAEQYILAESKGLE